MRSRLWSGRAKFVAPGSQIVYCFDTSILIVTLQASEEAATKVTAKTRSSKSLSVAPP